MIGVLRNRQRLFVGYSILWMQSVFIGAVFGAEPEQYMKFDILPERISHLSKREQDLILEYPQHFAALRAFYDNLTIDGIKLIETRVARGEWQKYRELTGTFKTRGFDHFLVDYSLGNERHLGVMNSKEWYIFNEHPSTNRLFIQAHGKTDSSYAYEHLVTYLYNSRPFGVGYLYSALCDTDGRDSKVFRIEELNLSDGEPIVRATVHTTFKEPYRNLCIVSLLKDRSWAVDELVFAGADHVKREYTVQRISCQYDRHINGMPVLSEVIQNQSCAVPFANGPGNPLDFYSPGGPEAPLSRERIIVSNLIPGPPPISEFDPAPYIAQIGGIGQTQTNSFRGLLLWINALFLLFLGVYLLRRRKQTSEPSPPALPVKGKPSA